MATRTITCTVEDMSTGGDNDVMKDSDDHALKAFSQLLALKAEL